MRTLKRVTRTYEEFEIDRYTCDWCLKEADPYEGDITQLSYDPGYGSKYDLETFTFHICDDCFEKFILGTAKGHE